MALEFSTLVGLAMIVGGYAIRFWGISHLKSAGLTNLVGTRVPKNWYSVTGPYRFCRHPLYWGGAAAMAGVGMIAFGWSGFVLAVPAVPYFVERGKYESEMRGMHENLDTLSDSE